MSLRRKLTLFFIAVVAIPVSLLAVVVLWVSGESSERQADAQLEASLETATSLYRQGLRAAPGEARRVAEQAAPEIESGDRGALQELADRELARPEVAAITITAADGNVLAQAGPGDGLADGSSPVRSGGEVIGEVRVSVLTSDEYLGRLDALTAGEAALVDSDSVVTSTVPLMREQVPTGAEPFDIDTGEDTTRAAAVPLVGEQETKVVMIATATSEPLGSVGLVVAALLVFLLAALLLLYLLLRGLRRRLDSMLAAAQRIGSGDFSRRIPLEGSDEMTDLAREINLMSAQISAQVEELERQRRRLDESVRRLGDAFASGLDREALLMIAIETVTEACNAESGRLVFTVDGAERILATSDPGHLAGVLERAVADAPGQERPAIVDSAGHHAMALAMTDGDEGKRTLCTMAVARTGRAFTAAEAEALSYLIGQTRASIENIELHELVARQAVTDDLTGISNRRHFVDWIEHETARLVRYEGSLSLIMLDIDDFKTINDGRGHLQGDRVLAAVAAVLREESREIDEVARYGGEEFVIGLPGTPREGALELAERLRGRIAALAVRDQEGGAPIAVTASFGVATAPADGPAARLLIAAADRALYDAKRQGKNRVVARVGGGSAIAEGN